jgi:hypothetical protein
MKNYILLIISISLYIIIGIINVFVTEKIVDYEWNQNTLYDIVHNNIKQFPPVKIINYLVYLFILYTIARWSPIDIKILSLYFLSLSILLILRLITFTTTQSPPPISKKNKWRIHNCKKKKMVNIGINFKKMFDSCVDNMFSAHTFHVITALTIIFLFSNNLIEKIILFLIAIFTVFSITSSRLHYTSDVIIAIIISPLITYFLKQKLF